MFVVAEGTVLVTVRLPHDYRIHDSNYIMNKTHEYLDDMVEHQHILSFTTSYSVGVSATGGPKT